MPPFTINDSRDFTFYVSSNEVDLQIQKQHGITDARSYKVYVQTNADSIIKEMSDNVVNKVHQDLSLYSPQS
jgi:hypothetical protein